MARSEGEGRAIWLVSLRARPGPGAEVGGEADPPGGALVNAYVVEASAEAAERLAREGVEGAGWWVESRHGTERLDLAALQGEAVDLVEQARVDGAVWVFHTWPQGAPDDPGPLPG